MNSESIRQVTAELYGKLLLSKQYENEDFIFIYR